MELYILPSILAISAKIALFIFNWKALANVDKYLLGFFACLCGVNFFELALILTLPEMVGAFFVIIMYYNFAILTVAVFVYYIMSLRGRVTGIGLQAIAGIGFVAIVCISVPGVALLGVESIGYSVTRIPGPFYPVVQASLLLGIIVASYHLWAACRSPDVLVRRKSVIWFVALTPLILSIIFIIVAMQLGYHVNATIVVSLETSFMMAVLIYAESKHRLFKFLTLIPKTEESKQWDEISVILNDDSLSLKDAQTRFTELYVRDALRRTEGNQVQAAKLLGTSRSTVYRYLPTIKE